MPVCSSPTEKSRKLPDFPLKRRDHAGAKIQGVDSSSGRDWWGDGPAFTSPPFRPDRIADVSRRPLVRALRAAFAVTRTSRRIPHERHCGQPFEILRMLLERPGSVVTVMSCGSDCGLRELSSITAQSQCRHQTANEQALGDDAQNPRFVETLARRGYRWRASDHPTNARVCRSQLETACWYCRSACWEVTRTSATGLRRADRAARQPWS